MVFVFLPSCSSWYSSFLRYSSSSAALFFSDCWSSILFRMRFFSSSLARFSRAMRSSRSLLYLKSGQPNLSCIYAPSSLFDLELEQVKLWNLTPYTANTSSAKKDHASWLCSRRISSACDYQKHVAKLSLSQRRQRSRCRSETRKSRWEFFRSLPPRKNVP